MTDVSKENYDFQKIVFVVGGALLVIKFAAYFITNSVAIYSDAMESIVNVVAGGIGLYALYLSAKPADKSHPFGHGRIELISATVEGAMIAVAGVMIIFEAVKGIISPPQEIPDLDIGLLLIIFAAAVNFIVGTIAVIKGRRNRSIALEASGRHLRTDTLSSVGIILGLTIVFIGSKLGYNIYILDPLMALAFGVFVIVTGARVLKKALDGIMDKADLEILEQTVECLNKHRSDEWIDIHNLRVIKYGTKLHIEMHLTLPFDMTIAEMEKENRLLHESVESMFEGAVDLMMMPEPCKEFSCIHCNKDCKARRVEFKETIVWSVNLLAQGHQHAYGNHVVIQGLNEPGER